ncbi:hypothetical protein [Paractinoplanes lichenicola]|uniref:Secreted protein n=1 Tax=Paractinoplanes lichenicola TaxID=2802976 RepID=A0ABS1VJB0_9ACTN|nr:hypothetical protein [Actinoplanes lichenicola]MBL7253531.1 hypothetical protein [Actinoplanes lichenicola]
MVAIARTARRSLMVPAATLIVALPLAAASPADAASACGATKTVRISIHYRACNETLSGHKVGGIVFVQNNHGSEVELTVKDGYRINGGGIGWNPNNPQRLTVKTGGHNYAVFPYFAGCHQGNSVGYVFQVYDNRTGKWGAISYSTPVTCP